MVNDQMTKTSMDKTQDQVKPMVKPATDPTESLEKQEKINQTSEKNLTLNSL